MPPPGVKIVATNRHARHDYDILDTFEAGIVLQGSEVKSLREAKVQLAESYARIDGGEAWLVGLHVAPWRTAGEHSGHDPVRRRKLLLHREELDRLRARLDQERLTLVPLALYFKDGRAKLEIGVGRGRTRGDKRQAIAEREAAREAQKAMSRARRLG